MTLCSLCQRISPWNIPNIFYDPVEWGNQLQPESSIEHHQTLIELRQSSTTCELCKLIFNSLLENRDFTRQPLQEDAAILLASKHSPHDDLQIGPQLNTITVQCGKQCTYLNALAEEESEAAKSNVVAGRFPVDPASQKCFDMASKWLETCIKTHIHRCRIDETDTISDNIADTECVKFPTRILDVGNDNSEGIRLIESSELTGQYATLSHRWPNDPAKHFKTTSSSIDRYKTSIVIDEMPPTFQDAVRVTRKLGLKYLWIDSLCILQDSVEDWERESAVMGLIYYHSTVTIMAANNLNQYNNSPQTLASENFLHRVIAVEPQIVKLQFRSEDGTIGGHWYLRHQKPILAGRWDLFSRGWVLQEEQLSRRKIMFLGDCIFWQCHMHMIPDFQRDVILDLKKADESKSWKDQFFSDHWFGTAEMYSERTFTFETDKLPGLSGLASHLSQRHGKSYYAGIFSDSIADGLLWSPARPGCLFRTDSTSYIAPSWSWLSAHGSIKMVAPTKIDALSDSPKNDSISISALQDVSFELTPAGRNPLGRLKSGQMSLIGNLKKACMRTKRGPHPLDGIVSSGLHMQLEADSKPMGSFFLDYADIVPANFSSEEVECLSVLQDYEHVLILRKLKGEEKYERIGLASIDPEWFVSGGSRKESITII